MCKNSEEKSLVHFKELKDLGVGQLILFSQWDVRVCDVSKCL